MILLTGASGKTGRAILKTLANVASVCAFVHHETSVSVAKSLGAEKVIVGNLRDEVAIRSAMQGARSVYHICPNMNPDETGIGKLVIDAARNSKVKHFVYHSVLHPQTEKMNHHWQKLQVEEMLFEAGLPFTILQPAPYMQNLLAGWKAILEDGLLRVPYSVDSKFSFIDLEDLAEAAKIVLTEPGHENATYELVGTSPLPHTEVAELFEVVLRRKVRAEKEEIRNWKSRVSGINMYTLEHLLRMFEYYDGWGLLGNPNVLRWVLKREPTSLETFIRRNMKEQDATH